MAEAATGCPRCGVIRKGGEARCLACDALLPPTAMARFVGLFVGEADHPPEVDRTIPCPRCASGTLRSKRIGQLLLRECRVCAGRWVAHVAFDRFMTVHGARALVQNALPPSPSASPDLAPGLHCPFCEEAMRRVNFAHLSRVTIDVCARHGLWFDAGELEKIASFVDAGGLRRSRLRGMQIASAAMDDAPVRRPPEISSERAMLTPDLVFGVLELLVEIVMAMLG